MTRWRCEAYKHSPALRAALTANHVKYAPETKLEENLNVA
jgi:hypothetical protein